MLLYAIRPTLVTRILSKQQVEVGFYFSHCFNIKYALHVNMMFIGLLLCVRHCVECSVNSTV